MAVPIFQKFLLRSHLRKLWEGVFLHLLILICLQLKRILRPKWHILGQHILVPYSGHKWKECALYEMGHDCWGPVVWKC